MVEKLILENRQITENANFSFLASFECYNFCNASKGTHSLHPLHSLYNTSQLCHGPLAQLWDGEKWEAEQSAQNFCKASETNQPMAERKQKAISVQLVLFRGTAGIFRELL